MPFPDAMIDKYVAMAPTAHSIRADIKAAANQAYDAFAGVLVTTCGKSENSAPFIDVTNRLLEAAEQAAKEVQDYSG